MSTHIVWNSKLPVFIITVLTLLVHTTHGQSYIWPLRQSQRNFYSEEIVNPPLTPSTQHSRTDIENINSNYSHEEDVEDINNNSTLVVIKNIREKPTELSQTAMDIITIVWYVATFLALAAFFMLMACSERRCGENRRSDNTNTNDSPLPPPTPSPSYSEFAPPSYETVMKMQHAAKTSIFVIPFPMEDHHKVGEGGGNNSQPQTPTTPAVNFYTINELQKLGS